MNVLILGSGGREHAFAWKIAQSEKLNKLYIAPGNGGTRLAGENVSLNPNNFDEIGSFVTSHAIDLVVVGPEEPLVLGIYDYFKSQPQLKDIALIGPSKRGALLEGSKDFAKQFMMNYGIPTARYQSFTLETISQAYAFLETLSPPYVLKADGLAAGKGVIILEELTETRAVLQEMLEGKFGAASHKVVIEEFLQGIELSVFVITDGKDYQILPEAKDYKRIGTGDTGMNTGGMGAISPVPFADDTFMEKVENEIIKPTIAGLSAEKIAYEGFIFFGLINVKGNPYVIEYNVRMGDPETEVVLPRIKTDLLELLLATSSGNLSGMQVIKDSRAAATIMLVSGGYPGIYEKGKKITGIPEHSESIIFHAGTKFEGNDYYTNGGRVLSITSYGNDRQESLNRSFNLAEKVAFEGKYYRNDIGFDL